MAEEKVTAFHTVPEEVPVSPLECTDAFGKLTTQEKLYAHFLSRASWSGAEIVLEQTSEEARPLFNLFLTVFGVAPLSELAQACTEQGITAQQWTHFLQYASSFFGNMGNYLSFGDTKIIPRLAPEAFLKIVQVAQQKGGDAVNATVQSILSAQYDGQSFIQRVYSLEPRLRSLGYPPESLSTYYTQNVTQAEIKQVNDVMINEQLSPYNTRLFKTTDANGATKFELRLASAQASRGKKIGPNESIEIVYGDHKESMSNVVKYLREAEKHVANEHQRKMIQAYIKSFDQGSIDDHKESQRHWVADVGPVVESNIGFIESYRDPFGVRGEWEGFVAVVNKETSRKFNELVDGAVKFLPKLPWGTDWEKDRFLRPDFTSLEVITFTTSGIPAGINIPNYDDIRQNIGFKNVSLGNVLSAPSPNQPITFLKESDHKLYEELKVHSFEVQVGCHELLGHGSGKLLMETAPGQFNFSRDLIDPYTNQPVASWYKPGETYDTQFSAMGSAFEECRAECVGVFLSADADLLKIFGYTGQKADDITYINWLNMVRAGVLALEFYTPESKQWRQAHMQARFGILRTLLAAGQGFVTLHSDYVELDRSKIHSVGVPAIAEFLRKIQIFKATADVARASALFHEATDVPEEYLQLRNTVLAKKQPRKVFVQSHTKVVNGEVQLVNFPASNEGLIESMVARFQDMRRE